MWEQEIINVGLENLRKTTEIQGHWQHGGPLDGLLYLNIDNSEREFIIEVKKEIRAHQLHQIFRFKQDHPNLILVAKKLFPKIKEELRQNRIPYLEANGNFYLQEDPVYILIDTNRTVQTKKETGNRAFTKTGLKVLYQFLIDKNLINQTQRIIANETGVALGNIPQVINGLQETGYLLTYERNHYLWENRKALLDRWVTEYDTQLKPTLLKSRFKLRKEWGDVRLQIEDTVWGGEPAGDLMTNHLRPEEYTLYTKLNTPNLLKAYPLIPDPNGNVYVYEQFWKGQPVTNTAHPILVYADLMLQNNKRSRETAEMIYNEHIQPIL